MEIPTRSVFQKTGKGVEELKTRRHGLASRLRQLLILVDGRRDLDELARVLPGPDLARHLEELESGGFVTRPLEGSAQASGGSTHVPAGSARPPEGPAPSRQAPPGHRPESGPGDVSGSAALQPVAPPPRARDLQTVRAAVTRALLDTIGPNGDDFAMRIERTRSIDELRALLPAALSVVEACGGRAAVDGFLRRCGAI